MQPDFRTTMVAALSLSAMTAAIVVAPAYAAATSAATVKAAIAADPGIVGNALMALQAKAAAGEEEQVKDMVAPVARGILKGDPAVAYVGNPKAKKRVIEFFDYNCGYCKRFSRGSVEPMVAAGDVRIDLVQTPILGPGSRRMAEFAAAAQLQGRFAQAHAYLIEQHAPTKADADALRPMLIRTAGIDRAKFERALTDGTAAKIVDHNAELSKRGGITGTPLIYTNGRVFRGYVDLETLRSAL